VNDHSSGKAVQAILQFPEFPKLMAHVRLWAKPDRPDEAELRNTLASDGFQALRWRQRPSEGYPPHAHIYPETIWLVSGTLTVVLPAENRLLELCPGDRVDIPRGYLHGTIAGPDGATYLVATR
jgi:quercetin dioxygenase-like cupin family protein